MKMRPHLFIMTETEFKKLKTGNNSCFHFHGSQT